jgi:hypothetical protein
MIRLRLAVSSWFILTIILSAMQNVKYKLLGVALKKFVKSCRQCPSDMLILGRACMGGNLYRQGEGVGIKACWQEADSLPGRRVMSYESLKPVRALIVGAG